MTAIFRGCDVDMDKPAMNLPETLQVIHRVIALPVQQRHADLEEPSEKGVDFTRLRIPRDVDVEVHRELSCTQRRIWSLWQMNPQSAAGNLSSVIRLHGPLNVLALHRACDSVIARHEALRTVFRYEPGIGPSQAPLMRRSFVVHTDLRALPTAQREQCAKALAEHHALQPFDLTVGPLLRVSLLKLADNERLLLLCMHRIVSDETAMRVLIDDLIRYLRIYDRGAALA
jgi:hypothetical protein